MKESAGFRLDAPRNRDGTTQDDLDRSMHRKLCMLVWWSPKLDVAISLIHQPARLCVWKSRTETRSQRHQHHNNNHYPFFFLIHSFVKQTVIVRAISIKAERKIQTTKNQVRVSDEGVSLLRNQNNHAPACQQKQFKTKTSTPSAQTNNTMSWDFFLRVLQLQSWPRS